MDRLWRQPLLLLLSPIRLKCSCAILLLSNGDRSSCKGLIGYVWNKQAATLGVAIFCNTDNLPQFSRPTSLAKKISLRNKISGSSSEAAIESSLKRWTQSKWKTQSTFQSSWLKKIVWTHRSPTPWNSFLPVRGNSVACQLAEAGRG